MKPLDDLRLDRSNLPAALATTSYKLGARGRGAIRALADAGLPEPAQLWSLLATGHTLDRHEKPHGGGYYTHVTAWHLASWWPRSRRDLLCSTLWAWLPRASKATEAEGYTLPEVDFASSESMGRALLWGSALALAVPCGCRASELVALAHALLDRWERVR